MKRILIQKDDVKSRSWAKEAAQLGLGELIPCTGSPMRLPLKLLQLSVGRKKLTGVCLRYLNDYPSYFKSAVRLFTDVFTVIIVKLLDKELLWICHNVDKETNEYHPWMVVVRRFVLIKFANRIFVTDELLKEPARRILKVADNRLRVVSFGLEESSKSISTVQNDEIETIRGWVQSRRMEHDSSQIGLWIGTLEEKKVAGLRKALQLAQEADKENIPLHFVIVGPIRGWLAKNLPSVLEELESCEHVLFIGTAVEISAVDWKKLFDFIWKPLDDLSVSLTAFNSATAGIPLFCENGTFMGDHVEHYKIGYSVGFGELSCQDVNAKLRGWTPEPCKRFLEMHTWARGAQALLGN